MTSLGGILSNQRKMERSKEGRKERRKERRDRGREDERKEEAPKEVGEMKKEILFIHIFCRLSLEI